MKKTVIATLTERPDGTVEVLMQVTDLPDCLYVFPSRELAKGGLWRAVMVGEEFEKQGIVTRIEVHGEIGAPATTDLLSLAEVIQ